MRGKLFVVGLLLPMMFAWEGRADFCPDGGVVHPTGNSPFAIRVCDLDGNGLWDLITANADNDTLSVLLSGAGGTYAAPVVLATGNEPVDLACCDVDADGDLDVVTVNHTSDDVRVHFNDGGGQLAAPGTSYLVGEAPWGVQCVHLNGDGRWDLVTANYTGDSVSVLGNNGNGTFAPRVDYATGNGTFAVAVCDMDGDGDADVVASNLLSSNVSVLRNNFNGTLTSTGTFTVGVNVFPWGIACADLDGDHDADVLTAGSSPLTVLFNSGGGALGNPVSYTTGLATPYKLDVADLDGDGDIDVVLSDLGNDDLRVFLNQGNGTLGAAGSLPVGGNPGSVVCRDLDTDGDADITTCSTGGAIVFENNCGCVSGADCDDGNGCTLDSCLNGSCAYLPVRCDDFDACTVDECSSGACQHTPVACDAPEICYRGLCYVPCSTVAECDDSVGCTDDACDTSPPPPIDGICRHTPDDAGCATELFCAQEECDPAAGCVPRRFCTNVDGNPCPDPGLCDEENDRCAGCLPPTVTAAGGRYLLVTPDPGLGSTPIALRLAGDCADDQIDCASYVQSRCTGGSSNGANCLTDADCPRTCAGGVTPGQACADNSQCVAGACAGFCDAGALDATPFFKTAAQWGTGRVRGTHVRPGKEYILEAECDVGGSTVRSEGVGARTWRWGDVDNDGDVDAIDITLMVNKFRGLPGTVPLEQVDIWPCAPDRVINALDIALCVDAFRGRPFSCVAPCP